MVCFHFTIKPNIYGAIAAKLLGLKVINNITGLGTTFIHNNFISMIVRLLYRISQPFADKVFCQNQDDLELLKNNGLVNKKKLILVPGSGIDIEKFSPINSTRKPNEIFTFVYIGRLLVDKGLRELVDAVCKLNKNKLVCRLEIYGEPDSNNISSIVDEELIMWRQYSGISLKGHTDEPELALMSADCVVLPSYREGMPRSLLEAGSMALPAVATNVPGCKHFITDGLNGYLCEAKDTRSLQLKMKLMLETSFEKRVAMGEASRAIILQKFDEKILINFVINLIESMDSSELNQA
jgi:glycosyltransferase involved in cell wall biosynthesis